MFSIEEFEITKVEAMKEIQSPLKHLRYGCREDSLGKAKISGRNI